MLIERIEKKVVAHFDSVLEYAEYADGVPEHNYSKCHDSNRWSGGTFEDAMNQAKTGNPERVKVLFRGIDTLESLIDIGKQGEIRDVTGEYFDVSDFLAGEPEVFRREDVIDQKPVIPIYAAFMMNSGVDPSLINNRGCAIVALCDELSSMGYIVDLNLVASVVFNGIEYHTKVNVRIDPLDIDAVAFILSNPLCLRRLWLASLERYTDREECGCYGTIIEYSTDDIFSTGLSGFYFASSNHNQYRKENFKTLESAKKHILGMVEQFKESASQIILG